MRDYIPAFALPGFGEAWSPPPPLGHPLPQGETEAHERRGYA
jgi:hypothetical protein